MIDFPQPPKRPPTKKELTRFNKWITYLSDSRLSKEEVYRRAAQYAGRGEEVPK